MARKGAVPRERVLSAHTLSQFRTHLESRKPRQGNLKEDAHWLR
jgi:hypothetical protein